MMMISLCIISMIFQHFAHSILLMIFLHFVPQFITVDLYFFKTASLLNPYLCPVNLKSRTIFAN